MPVFRDGFVAVWDMVIRMKVLAFGEILWDQFGDKMEIGGAPFNFSAHLAKLGASVGIVSAVGSDTLGQKTLDKIRSYAIEDAFVGVNAFPTGVCRVTTNEAGTPSYDLVKGVAYDAITLNEQQLETIRKEYGVLYFGTLAQRSAVSQKTLCGLQSRCPFHEVFCDLNIRQHYYHAELVESCLRGCTILKVSREEYSIFEELGLVKVKKAQYSDDMHFSLELCKELDEKYSIDKILITLDKDGALLYCSDKQQLLLSKKPKNKAISTVGAGDSFSACFLYNYLNGAPLETCINRGVELSDFVVTEWGAIPDYPPDLMARIV